MPLSPKRDSAEWILRELEGSAAQRDLQKIVESVHELHDRTGGPLARYGYAELEDRLIQMKSEPGLDRPRAWRQRIDDLGVRERDDYPLDYIERHLSKCRTFAHLYLRDESLAWAVHDCARFGEWPSAVTTRRMGLPAPENGTGSPIAVLYNGASWGTDRASQRRAASRFFGGPAKFNVDKKPL